MVRCDVMKWFIATLRKEFAKYGFTTCPLTEQQLTTLYKLNIKLEDAYSIGCDVNSGYHFDVALDATLVDADHLKQLIS